MTLDEKIDKIHDSVNTINTNVALLTQSINTMNERGCEASMKAIDKIKEKQSDDYNFIKKIAVIGAAIGSAIGGSVGWLSGRH